MEATQQQKQLALFETSLPAKPYCSNDLAFGLHIRKADFAKTNRYIQHNKPTTIHWLAFDCDQPNAVERADFNNLPTPNIAVINRENGHSHLLYGLEVPVYKTRVARQKPLQFLAKVEYALLVGLEADPQYRGLIVKNPLHSHWLTYQLRADSYDLAELADYFDLPKKLPKKAHTLGLGRNCSLFDSLRYWAYSHLLTFRLSGTYEAWSDALLVQAMALNTFPVPLPQSEIKSTAKSIAKWTWNHYTGRMDDNQWAEYVKATHTPEVQAARGRLGGIGKGRANQEKRSMALLMRSEGMTQQDIANCLQVSQRTISNWTS